MYEFDKYLQSVMLAVGNALTLGPYLTFPTNPSVFSCISEQSQRFCLTREILSNFSPFDLHVWENPYVSGSFSVAHYSKN
jgi:hypothetical protein